jgi:hypothetical protein
VKSTLFSLVYGAPRPNSVLEAGDLFLPDPELSPPVPDPDPTFINDMITKIHFQPSLRKKNPSNLLYINTLYKCVLLTFYSLIWKLNKSAGIYSSDPDPDTEPPILNGRIRNRSNSVPDANESIAGLVEMFMKPLNLFLQLYGGFVLTIYTLCMYLLIRMDTLEFDFPLTQRRRTKLRQTKRRQADCQTLTD